MPLGIGTTRPTQTSIIIWARTDKVELEKRNRICGIKGPLIGGCKIRDLESGIEDQNVKS